MYICVCLLQQAMQVASYLRKQECREDPRAQVQGGTGRTIKSRESFPTGIFAGRAIYNGRPAAGAAATGPEIIPTAGGPSCLAAHHLRASDLLKGRADARSSWSKLPAATGVRALPRHAVLEELEVALRNFRLD